MFKAVTFSALVSTTICLVVIRLVFAFTERVITSFTYKSLCMCRDISLFNNRDYPITLITLIAISTPISTVYLIVTLIINTSFVGYFSHAPILPQVKLCVKSCKYELLTLVLHGIVRMGGVEGF